MVCRRAGLRAVLPLWNMERDVLLGDFLSFDYRATIVSVREDEAGRLCGAFSGLNSPGFSTGRQNP